MKIIMIGAGKLASNLALACLNMGHEIIQVYSRNMSHAKALAIQTNSVPINELDSLDNLADLYIIAVSDSAIHEILERVDFSNKSVVHTAGSVPLSIFDPRIHNCGVFYPLQSFSKGRLLEFKNIPIFIEANNNQFKLLLSKFANQLSQQVWDMDSESRKMVHLSGVFANNFVNHIYTLSEQILRDKGIPFNILGELIKETAAKALEMGPEQSQTGPAIRNDAETQKKHLDLLSSKPEIQQLYMLISNNISLKYK